MEAVIALLIMFGVGGGIFAASSIYDKHSTAKRAIEIKRANDEDKKNNEVSQKQLEQYFREAREAEQAEQKLLSDNWNQQFLELLPDTDPMKNAYNLKKAGIEVLEADDLYPPAIPYTGEQLPYSERTVAKATAYVRHAPTDTSDFIATFQRGAIIRVYGYVRGRQVGKTDIWYQIKTKSFEGWIWSGSLNSSDTKGLSRLELVRPTRGNLDRQGIKKAFEAAEKAMYGR
jgi:hypothetical protein